MEIMYFSSVSIVREFIKWEKEREELYTFTSYYIIRLLLSSLQNEEKIGTSSPKKIFGISLLIKRISFPLIVGEC